LAHSHAFSYQRIWRMLECIKSQRAHSHASPCRVIFVKSCVYCRVKYLQRTVWQASSVSVVHIPESTIGTSEYTIFCLFVSKIRRRTWAHCNASSDAHVSIFVWKIGACAIGDAHLIGWVVVKIGTGWAVDDASASRRIFEKLGSCVASLSAEPCGVIWKVSELTWLDAFPGHRVAKKAQKYWASVETEIRCIISIRATGTITRIYTQLLGSIAIGTVWTSGDASRCQVVAVCLNGRLGTCDCA
jgi:hypothetical protein